MVPPSARFPTRRAALAEEAARRALAGLGPELVLPQLRAQTVQELLAQPGGAGCELCGTLQTLTGALTQCVRRRPGWLYAMFPSGITCPVPARPALVQAAVLEALRPVLACGGQAVLEVKPRSRAVLLCLRGGAPAGVLPLWQALARQSGGAVVFDSGAQFAAAAFLPLCPGCRIQKSPSTQELLEDRSIDEGRLVTEAAIFADKTAIDEETVRLHSHVAQYREILELDEPIGRKLDFLTQELNRESNTIGSKCQDVAITRLVVELKSENSRADSEHRVTEVRHEAAEHWLWQHG